MARTWCVPAVPCASSIPTRPSATSFLRPGPLLSDVKVQKGAAVPGGRLCASFLFRIRISYTTTTFLHSLLFLSFLVEAFPAQRGQLLPMEHCALHPGPLAALIARLLRGFVLCSVNCVVAPNRAFVLRFRFRQVLSLLEAEGFYFFI